MPWIAESKAIPLPNGTLGAPPTSPTEGAFNHEINWPPIPWATDALIDVVGPPGLGGGKWRIQISSPGVGHLRDHCVITEPGRVELPRQVQDVKVICDDAPENITIYFYLVVR